MAGWARIPIARARRAPTGEVSPSRARICAIRSHIARNTMTSPASARAINVFRPCSSDCPAATNCSSSRARRRSSAAVGSTAMISAVTSRSNDAHAKVSTCGVVAASTIRAWVRSRPAAWTSLATLRAFHTRPCPAARAAHMWGWRCWRSNASRIRLSAEMNPVPINAASSAHANSVTWGVPGPPSCLTPSTPGTNRPVRAGSVSALCSTDRPTTTGSPNPLVHKGNLALRGDAARALRLQRPSRWHRSGTRRPCRARCRRPAGPSAGRASRRPPAG